jgi:hypothetical protein
MIGAVLTSSDLVKFRKNEFGFLLIIIILSVMIALFYGVYTMGGALRYRAYIPTARYIYPAIIPISLFLVIGWYGLLTWATKLMKVSFQAGNYFFWGFFIALDLYSIASVLYFFYKP